MIFDLEGTQTVGEQEVEFIAQLEASWRPAQLFRPPERCYEAEGEIEILSIATIPPGFENQLDEDALLDAAWDKFHQLRWEGEA